MTDKSMVSQNDIDLHELVVHGPLFELYDQMLGEVDIVDLKEIWSSYRYPGYREKGLGFFI